MNRRRPVAEAPDPETRAEAPVEAPLEAPVQPAAAPEAARPVLPSEGGSYIRNADGTLTREEM